MQYARNIRSRTRSQSCPSARSRAALVLSFAGGLAVIVLLVLVVVRRNVPEHDERELGIAHVATIAPDTNMRERDALEQTPHSSQKRNNMNNKQEREGAAEEEEDRNQQGYCRATKDKEELALYTRRPSTLVAPIHEFPLRQFSVAQRVAESRKEGGDEEDGMQRTATSPLLASSSSHQRQVLLAVGIPTTDTAFGAERRRLQRQSWLTYRAVSSTHHHSPHSEASAHSEASSPDPRGASSPTATMQVVFLLARHPQHQYRYSTDLCREWHEHRGDMVALDMKEGVSTTGKKSGQSGYWGLASEVGMSRKALAWYRLARVLFPTALYVAKCDDDVFVRVPQYVRDLTLLDHLVTVPQEREQEQQVARNGRGGGGVSLLPSPLYWGKSLKWQAVKQDSSTKFYFIGGMMITMHRDLLTVLGNFRPLMEHADVEFPGFPTKSSPKGSNDVAAAAEDPEVKTMYKGHNMDHEDVMVGRALYDGKTNVSLVRDCRLHDVHTGANVKKITGKSLVVHHLKADEYGALMRRFGEGEVSHDIAFVKREESPPRRRYHDTWLVSGC